LVVLGGIDGEQLILVADHSDVAVVDERARGSSSRRSAGQAPQRNVSDHAGRNPVAATAWWNVSTTSAAFVVVNARRTSSSSPRTQTDLLRTSKADRPVENI
jgi:hypothetical protein